MLLDSFKGFLTFLLSTVSLLDHHLSIINLLHLYLLICLGFMPEKIFLGSKVLSTSFEGFVKLSQCFLELLILRFMSCDSILEGSGLDRYLVCIQQPFNSFELFVLLRECLLFGASLERSQQVKLLLEVFDLFANVFWDFLVVRHACRK